MTAAEKFYHSKAWKDCREAFITERRMIDGGLCQRCHGTPGYIVHHKIHLNEHNITDPDIALSFSNLEFVCHKCHNDEHFGHYSQLRVSFSPEGKVLPR